MKPANLKPKPTEGNDEMMMLELGYGHKYVLTNKDAFLMSEILCRAERMQTSYVDRQTIYYVYPNEDTFRMETIPDAVYQVAKLAGKPE